MDFFGKNFVLILLAQKESKTKFSMFYEKLIRSTFLIVCLLTAAYRLKTDSIDFLGKIIFCICRVKKDLKWAHNKFQ